MTRIFLPAFAGLRFPQSHRHYHCHHCERATTWREDLNGPHCMTCGREAETELPPAGRPADRPSRPSADALAPTRRFLRRYPRVLLIAVLLVASFMLAAWLDTRATASAATDGPALPDTTTAVSAEDAAHAAALGASAPSPTGVLTAR